MPDLRRIRCRTAYDGTSFHGWQVQPGRQTIQAELQRVISEIEGAPVMVVASGRTDSGVHALRQMIAFSLRNPIPCDNLRRTINRLLPHSIRVFEVEETHAEFHPRFDAVSKHYQYRIWRDEICLPFDRPYMHHYPYPLDEAIMTEAASLLEGEHDFTAFAAADKKDALGYSKVRKIFRSELRRDGSRLIFDVEGSGFLKHMVRNLIGTIVETGKGNLTIEDFKSLLRTRPPESISPPRSPTEPRPSGSGPSPSDTPDFQRSPHGPLRAAQNHEGRLAQCHGNSEPRPSGSGRHRSTSRDFQRSGLTKAGPTLPAQGLFLIDVRYC